MSDTTPIILSLDAMATRFELVLHGDDPARLRAAGEEALGEIERLEAQMSLYRPDSELSWINARAAEEPVKVEPRLFGLLGRCAGLSAQTDGAFDITVAPLMRAWGFQDGAGRVPDAAELEAARETVGMAHVHLDAEDSTIRFDRPGVQIDLGAVGKGYAIEHATNILRENGITSALLHGGTSTVSAIGTQPDGSPWRIAVRDSLNRAGQMETFDLHDRALSISAIHGKSFVQGGCEFGHVIVPGSGQPAQGMVTAAVAGPSPTECDALSTALLALGEAGLPMLAERFPNYSFLAVVPTIDNSRKNWAGLLTAEAGGWYNT